MVTGRKSCAVWAAHRVMSPGEGTSPEPAFWLVNPPPPPLSLGLPPHEQRAAFPGLVGAPGSHPHPTLSTGSL